MRKNVVNGVEFYTFDNFEKAGGTMHCFSSKIGGVSEGCYSEMNLGFNRGDPIENVMENFNRLSEAVGFSCENIVFSDQVHDTDVMHVGLRDRGKGIFKTSDICNIDGLMTNEKDVMLTTFYADCVPLYFYDTAKKAVALSHAGWRGTLNKIGAVTIEKMEKQYGSDPTDIIAGIGPSIGKCCFEIDNPVAEEFRKGLSFAEDYITCHTEIKYKYLIDLWGINKRILIDAGIRPENIEISGLCTKCNGSIFYSHRVCGMNRGSMAAFLQLA